VNARFEIFDSSVDESVVLWDLAATRETYFYDLSTILKMSILWSAESRLWHPHSHLFFVYLWKFWSLQSWVESSGVRANVSYTCSHTQVINRVDRYVGNRNANITGSHTVLNIQLELVLDVYTSPTRCMKTHHITVSVITPQRLNNFDCQHFNHYPFVTYIYITHIILSEIIILLWSDGDTFSHISTFAFL